MYTSSANTSVSHAKGDNVSTEELKAAGRKAVSTY